MKLMWKFRFCEGCRSCCKRLYKQIKINSRYLYNLYNNYNPSNQSLTIIRKPRIQGHAAIHKYGDAGNIVGIV
jgi:hypothetical protein